MNLVFNSEGGSQRHLKKKSAEKSIMFPRAAKAGSGPPPPSRGRLAKILDTESERLTVSCRVHWAGPERVNLYSLQIMSSEKDKNVCNKVRP